MPGATELRLDKTGDSLAVRSCLLKVLEEILQLEEIVRTSKEDTEDLKNRVEQLELFIENHRSSLVDHDSAEDLLKSPTADQVNSGHHGNSKNCPIKPPKHDIKSGNEIKKRFLSRREFLYDQVGLRFFKLFTFVIEILQ